MTRRCSARIHRLQLLTFVVRTPPPPFQIRVTISPTFSPHELDPRISDLREFGAQVGYGFTQTEPARAKASRDNTFIAC